MTNENIIPFNALSQRKQAQLQSSSTKPKMYLSIENSELEPSQNCTLYTIEIGIQKDQNVHIHQVINLTN